MALWSGHGLFYQVYESFQFWERRIYYVWYTFSVNDPWANETLSAHKEKVSEATEVTCVTKVQDNSNACLYAAQLKIKDESVCNSMQTVCEGTSHTSESESQFLYCSESGTDISDIHDISRCLELEQSGG